GNPGIYDAGDGGRLSTVMSCLVMSCLVRSARKDSGSTRCSMWWTPGGAGDSYRVAATRAVTTPVAWQVSRPESRRVTTPPSPSDADTWTANLSEPRWIRPNAEAS